MNNFKKNTLLLILSTFSIFSVSASYRLVLQSGHDGIPVAVQWHEKSKTIVSAGVDGRLIVTRPRDNKVLHRFRITDENIYDLKVDPVNSRAAVITSKNGIYTVSVWNWLPVLSRLSVLTSIVADSPLRTMTFGAWSCFELAWACVARKMNSTCRSSSDS